MELAKTLAKRHGYLTESEVDALQDLARVLPPACKCVNIGAGFGTSTMAILEIRPELSLISIDISFGGNPYGGLQNEKEMFERLGYSAHVPRQILGDSKDVATFSMMAGRWAGYVFVDGDHTLAGITGDINGWRPHVLVGGYMVFHDFGSPNWGIKDTIIEMMKEDELIKVVDTVAIYKVLV